MPTGAFETRILQGLKACLDLSFPKTCHCGVVYESLADFIAKTEPLKRNHGLMDYNDREQNRTIVGLYRNCRCHSTLMAVCDDRRDNSPNGIARRHLFEDLLQLLEDKGINREIGRLELLKMLRSERSALLEAHGISQKQFHLLLPEE